MGSVCIYNWGCDLVTGKFGFRTNKKASVAAWCKALIKYKFNLPVQIWFWKNSLSILDFVRPSIFLLSAINIKALRQQNHSTICCGRRHSDMTISVHSSQAHAANVSNCGTVLWQGNWTLNFTTYCWYKGKKGTDV